MYGHPVYLHFWLNCNGKYRQIYHHPLRVLGIDMSEGASFEVIQVQTPSQEVLGGVGYPTLASIGMEDSPPTFTQKNKTHV